MSESRARLAACYRLFAWLLERGGDIDGIEAAVVREPVLDADVLGRPREHIGIRATRDIRPGEVLLRVPRELTLDVHLLIKHSATHLARRPALANFFPSREGAVLLSGIIESAYSDFWQPWRATLPATYLENPGLWWSMPGTFARTIRAVEAPITGYHALNISYEATGLGQYIREEHARFVQAYSDDPDPKHRAAVCGPRSFSWAMLTAATRGLRHLRDPSGQGLALVPILDLFNHDATENVAWNLTGVGDRVDAVKNNNVLKRTKPGVIKAVRKAGRADPFKLDPITHAYEIEYDEGGVEPGVPNTFIVGVAAVTATSASPAPQAKKDGDAAAPPAAVVNVNDEPPMPSGCGCLVS